MGFLAGCTTICGVLTLLIPETKGRTLDDIEHDVIYRRRHGLNVDDDVMSDSITTHINNNLSSPPMKEEESLHMKMIQNKPKESIQGNAISISSSS